MLQNEFEALTGMSVETEVYNTIIDPMYMATDMDKQPFCKDFKQHKLGESTVANALTDEVYRLRKEIEQMKKERSEVVDFLLSRCNVGCDHKAIKLVGHKAVLTIKMQKGYPLTEDDKAFIIEMCR